MDSLPCQVAPICYEQFGDPLVRRNGVRYLAEFMRSYQFQGDPDLEVRNLKGYLKGWVDQDAEVGTPEVSDSGVRCRCRLSWTAVSTVCFFPFFLDTDPTSCIFSSQRCMRMSAMRHESGI